MKIWALSDPHLSFQSLKPMHRFGEHWRGHWEKIAANWKRLVAPQDLVLVTGDISWAVRFDHALPDLEWLDQLPGHRKLMVRGNHDAWWPSREEQRARLPASLLLLDGEAARVGGQVFAGTCGWLAPNDPYFDPLDRPAYNRELAALERALAAGAALAEGAPFHLLLHFPPRTSRGHATPFEQLLRQYRLATVTYGHLHLAPEFPLALKGEDGGILFTLASADYIHFTPVPVWPAAQ